MVQRHSGLLSRTEDASLLGSRSNRGKEQAISYRGSSWGEEQQVRSNGKTVGGEEHSQTKRSDFLLQQTLTNVFISLW